MGLAASGDGAPSAENSGQEETEEVGNDDESIVHQTASVGDVEVRLPLFLFAYSPKHILWLTLSIIEMIQRNMKG